MNVANTDTVVFTCFVLTLGYLAYWWMQPVHSKNVRKSDKDQPALPLAARETNKPYGGGQNVWVKKFDPDTAKIVSAVQGQRLSAAK